MKSLLTDYADRIPPGSHFVIAVSGGADSLALTWASAFVLPRLGCSLEALVVDHGVHTDSAEIAALAATRVEALGVTASVTRVRLGRAGGMEHQAREARYRALREHCERTGAHGVLLGHTLDDQAETVLLGLARGSGPTSVRGMDPQHDLWWRPFLGLRRDHTRQVCLDAGITWWDDPHNTDMAYTRPRVRHTLLPALEHELGPGVVEALARTAELLRADDEALDAIANDIVTAHDAELHRGIVDLGILEGLHEAVASRVVRLAIRRVTGTSLTSAHTQALMGLVTHWHGQGPIDVPGASVVRKGNTLRITAHKLAKGS